MAFTKFEKDVANISKLSNRPNQNDGLSAAQLKGRFDKAPVDIQDFINDHIDELESTADNNSGADKIGVTPLTEGGSDRLQTALEEIQSNAEGLDSSAVHKAGNETISGIKTFATSPIIPTPSANNHAATKRYVDDKDATAVHNTGDETINGAKTFATPPVIPEPTMDSHASTRKYVDETINGLNADNVGAISKERKLITWTVNKDFPYFGVEYNNFETLEDALNALPELSFDDYLIDILSMNKPTEVNSIEGKHINGSLTIGGRSHEILALLSGMHIAKLTLSSVTVDSFALENVDVLDMAFCVFREATIPITNCKDIYLFNCTVDGAGPEGAFMLYNSNAYFNRMLYLNVSDVPLVKLRGNSYLHEESPTYSNVDVAKKIVFDGSSYYRDKIYSEDIFYDNSGGALGSENVQDAIKEIDAATQGIITTKVNNSTLSSNVGFLYISSTNPGTGDKIATPAGDYAAIAPSNGTVITVIFTVGSAKLSKINGTSVAAAHFSETLLPGIPYSFVCYGGTYYLQGAAKIDKTSIADDLETNDNTKVLSAKQGKVLNDNLDALGQIVDTKFNILKPILEDFTPLGVSWNKGESPILTRTDGAVGMVANVGIDDQVVINDFDSASIFRDIYRVTDTLGNEFVRIPKFYIRKTDIPGLKTWQICKNKLDGYYLPWCFWDFTNSRELPYIDVGCFNASLDGAKLASKRDTYPLISTNIVSFRAYAQNNNANGLLGYQQLDVHVIDVLRTLLFVEFGTLNLQAIMAGFTAGAYSDTHTVTEQTVDGNSLVVSNSTANAFTVGQTIACGTSRGSTSVFNNRTVTDINTYDENNKSIHFDGAPATTNIGNVVASRGWKSGFSAGVKASSGTIVANDGKFPCVYRGIENPFGNVWQFVDGINIDDCQAWVAKNADIYASNVFASPYEKLSYVNLAANGYGPVSMGYDEDLPFAEFATNITGGSTSKHYCDYYYQDAGSRIAHFGGSWSSRSNAGPSYWGLDSSSATAGVTFGGRLLKKPL